MGCIIFGPTRIGIVNIEISQGDASSDIEQSTVSSKSKFCSDMRIPIAVKSCVVVTKEPAVSVGPNIDPTKTKVGVNTHYNAIELTIVARKSATDEGTIVVVAFVTG